MIIEIKISAKLAKLLVILIVSDLQLLSENMLKIVVKVSSQTTDSTLLMSHFLISSQTYLKSHKCCQNDVRNRFTFEQRKVIQFEK